MGFGWLNNDSFRGYVEEFRCIDSLEFCKTDEVTHFIALLQFLVDELEGSCIRRCQILRVKLIQLLSVIRYLLDRDMPKLKDSIGRFVLHPDFSKVLISPSQIKEIESFCQN
jgi:hypothetical protein